jgi:mycoredoxin
MVEDDTNIDVRRDSPRMTASVANSVTSSVTMYTTPWCGYCHRLQGQMDREGIAYDVVDIERHPEAASFVESVNGGNQTVPTLVYADGTSQTNPSVMQVKEKLAALA